MEAMNIGLLYQEFVKAQKERIKKKKSQSKPKPNVASQPKAKKEEKVAKVKIEEDLPGKRRR